jgi:hypothetical protein
MYAVTFTLCYIWNEREFFADYGSISWYKQNLHGAIRKHIFSALTLFWAKAEEKNLFWKKNKEHFKQIRKRKYELSSNVHSVYMRNKRNAERTMKEASKENERIRKQNYRKKIEEKCLCLVIMSTLYHFLYIHLSCKYIYL